MFSVMMFISSFAGADDKHINKKHSEAGITCIDCHQTETPIKAAPQKYCIECHAGMEAKEITTLKSTDGKEYSVNPHNAHTGSLRCTLCHHIHSPSVLYCNKECHHSFTVSVP